MYRKKGEKSVCSVIIYDKCKEKMVKSVILFNKTAI